MGNTFDFLDKSVLLTGGTKGIGRAILIKFVEAGAKVITCARNEPADKSIFNLDSLIKKGKAEPNKVTAPIFVKEDLRDAEQINQLIKRVEKEFGHLDILINNAGGSPPAPAKKSSPNFNEKIIGLNLLAPLNLSIAAYPLLKKAAEKSAKKDGIKNSSTIINISSISAERPNPMGVAYAAAKSGLNNFTQTLAVEWGPDIRVVAVTAGLIATEDAHLYYGDEEGMAKVAETIPMKRMGTGDDIANACLFLASDYASWISGSDIKIHGGGESPAYLDASTGQVVEIPVEK